MSYRTMGTFGGTLIHLHYKRIFAMGFGSYDESEQDNQEIDTDIDETEMATAEADHDGNVEYEIDATNDELINRLQDIRDQDAS